MENKRRQWDSVTDKCDDDDVDVVNTKFMNLDEIHTCGHIDDHIIRGMITYRTPCLLGIRFFTNGSQNQQWKHNTLITKINKFLYRLEYVMRADLTHTTRVNPHT